MEEYGSVACLLERPTRETPAEQYSDTVPRHQSRKRTSQQNNYPTHTHTHTHTHTPTRARALPGQKAGRARTNIACHSFSWLLQACAVLNGARQTSETCCLQLFGLLLFAFGANVDILIICHAEIIQARNPRKPMFLGETSRDFARGFPRVPEKVGKKKEVCVQFLAPNHPSKV